MLPFGTNMQDELAKRLDGEKRVLFHIRKDEGTMVEEHAVSTRNIKLQDDLLIINDSQRFPFTEESIEFVEPNQAGIRYFDQDGYMIFVKIITE